jgi:cobalt-zinc-cadmium efflux system protein
MESSQTHAHGHAHPHDHSSSGNLKVAFFLNLFFSIVEIAGGLATNSLAILSDALHDFGDSVSLGVAWYFERVSTRGRTKRFTYGFRRYSLIGALVSGGVLLAGSVVILLHAIPRLFDPEEVQAEGMVALAVLGILVNGAAVLRLRRGKKLNERVVRLHLLEDLVGWTAVLAASIVMVFAELPILDPILSVVVTIFVLVKLFEHLHETFQIFLQTSPSHIGVDEVKKIVSSIESVLDVHDTHIWTMDGQYSVATVHIIVDDEISEERIVEIKTEARRELRNAGVEHVTIEMERSSEECELCGF